MEGAIYSGPGTASAAPEHTLRRFTAALGMGDLETAISCFAREACLITPNATAIRGHESIRPVLAQLILVRTEIAIQLSSALIVAEAALLRGRWTIRRNGANGTRYEQVTSPILVEHWLKLSGSCR
jgi:hypothetical protein